MSKAGLFTLDGAIDLHLHSGPSLAGRPLDDIETAQAAAAAGMQAILLKDHCECTASRAYYAGRAAPSIQVFGGIVLNTHVGGINPAAAEASLARGGKQVWMPTIDSQLHADIFGTTGTYTSPDKHAGPPIAGSERLRRKTGITIAENGDLKPETKEVVAIARDYDGIIGVSHIYNEEVMALARFAFANGAKKFLITHADWSVLRNLTIEQLEELANLGAFVEFCATCTFPPTYCFTPEKAVAWMKRLGAGRCVISSDAGAPIFPGEVESLRAYGEMLLAGGITRDELRIMMIDNPAGLLGL
ncbi:MAG: DUF6282 family protein [Chloroflexi bacterium]|nr:DUF6282 family protein [Chloroflexota bacterium]